MISYYFSKILSARREILSECHYWGPTNIGRHSTKFSLPQFGHPCVSIPYSSGGKVFQPRSQDTLSEPNTTPYEKMLVVLYFRINCRLRYSDSLLRSSSVPPGKLQNVISDWVTIGFLYNFSSSFIYHPNFRHYIILDREASLKEHQNI